MKIYFYTFPGQNEFFYAIYAANGLLRNGHQLVSIPTLNYKDPKTGEKVKGSFEDAWKAFINKINKKHGRIKINERK